jgi:hypothetical protein
MAMAGMAWLTAAAALAELSSPVAGLASAGLLAILVVMARTARDRVRHFRHNRFESVHRLGGWAALGILAVIVPVQAARSLPPGSGLPGLLRQPSVLLLVILVVLVAHPWLGGAACRPSSSRSPARWSCPRCRDGADGGNSSGSAARGASGTPSRWRRPAARALAGTASSSGARETGPGGSPATSRMGMPPARLWVRRMRGYGFMYHAQAYRRVLMVATGAGIGPVLPYLLGRSPVQFEFLWIGRCHRAAMGTDLVDRVLAGGPVTLIDTSGGRPDVGACVAGAAHRFVAVFVVSDDMVRDSVARACEALALPWYGPTFDS